MPGLLVLPTVVTSAAASVATAGVAGVAEGAGAFAPVLDQQLEEALAPGKISLPALLSSLIQRLSPLVVVDNHPGQSPAEAAAGNGDNPGNGAHGSLVGRIMQFLMQNGLAASPQEAAPLLQDLTIPQIEKLAAILDVPALALEEALAQLEALSPAEVLEVIAEAMTGDSESVEAKVEEFAAEAEEEKRDETGIVVTIAPASVTVAAPKVGLVTVAPQEIAVAEVAAVAVAPIPVIVAEEDETLEEQPEVIAMVVTPPAPPVVTAPAIVIPAVPAEISAKTAETTETREAPLAVETETLIVPFAPRRVVQELPLAPIAPVEASVAAVNENIPQPNRSAPVAVSAAQTVTAEAIVPPPVIAAPVVTPSAEIAEEPSPATALETVHLPSEGLKPKLPAANRQTATAANDPDAPAPFVAAEVNPAAPTESAPAEFSPEASDSLAVEAARTVTSLREALSPSRPEAPRFTPPRPEIPVPVVEQVLLKIRSTPGQAEKHYEIHLDPADLGKIDVQMEVDGAGRTQISVIADKRETLEMLQRDRVSLEKSLNDLGLKADAGSMQFNLREQGKGQSFADMQQQQQNRQNGWQGEKLPEELREEITPAQPYRGMILSIDEGINIRV